MIVAIIQARLGSNRLPEKVLADICGKPLLYYIIETLKAVHVIDDIMVATTTEPEDQRILMFADQCGVKTYAGSPYNVLDRYYQVAKSLSAEIIVRITADDPFKDPHVITKILDYLLKNPGLDYVSNTIEATYPEGLDVEVFTFKAIERAWTEASLLSEREHVTPYIWKNPDRFNIANIIHEQDLSHLRWTVDYKEDLCFVREVYRRLYSGQVLLMKDILSLLHDEPELMHISQAIVRNEGYAQSVAHDQKIHPK